MHNATGVCDFGEIASLQGVLQEVKKLRRWRQPQYVMLVEDDPMTRHLVTNAFKENYAMVTACNAREAVSNYLLYAPDVVFLDIGLPDASGFDVLNHIMECDPDAFVVMFSSNDYPENIAKAREDGAIGFVAKPFRKEHLQEYIHGSAIHHRKAGV